MSRLKACFELLAQENKSALIPFITAGDPTPNSTVRLMHEMVKAGVDIIELGIPFSDPMADGPVIQAADERALAHNVSLKDVIGMVGEFRTVDTKTPIVLMGYLNPIEMLGYPEFTEKASQAGIDGVLIVDMPPEESEQFTPLARALNIDVIYLISPTTSPERIKLIADQASGYLYYVSLKGVTGSSSLDVESVSSKLKEIKSITALPIGVGFGIKDGETAGRVAQVAEAVVVGSALVKQIEETPDDIEKSSRGITDLLSDMRNQMDQVTRTVR
jgi:tryptophan synthase alpha chain